MGKVFALAMGVLMAGCGGTVQEKPTAADCFAEQGCTVMVTCEPGSTDGCKLETGAVETCWPQAGAMGCHTQVENGQAVALWSCPTSYNGQCE